MRIHTKMKSIWHGCVRLRRNEKKWTNHADSLNTLKVRQVSTKTKDEKKILITIFFKLKLQKIFLPGGKNTRFVLIENIDNTGATKSQTVSSYVT